MGIFKFIMVKYILILFSIFYTHLSMGEQMNGFFNQNDIYRFSQLGIRDGLSHNQVNSFIKDSSGYLWIGTASGLNRYDGINLKVFNHIPNDPNTLDSNTIEKLFLDPAGNLWVKTIEGLNIYDPAKEKFRHNVSEYLHPYNVSDIGLQEIIQDSQGDFWFIQGDLGVSRFHPKTQKTTFFSAKLLSDREVSDIVSDKHGHIWVVFTDGTLEKRNGITLRLLTRIDDIKYKFSEEELSYKLISDRDGDVWIYLPNERRGVFFLNTTDNSLAHLNKNDSKVRLNSDLVSAVIEDEEGNIWIGTDHGGINLVNKKNMTVSYILHDHEIPNSLSHNSIYALYKDSDGMVWVGTYKNGLNYFHKNNIRFSHYSHQKSKLTSLPFNDVNRFEEDEKGNLWIGTNGGGLLYMDREKESFKQYLQSNSQGMNSDVVVSLLYDTNNTLWVGTYFGGLMKFDGKKFTSIAKDQNAKLIDDNIWELFEDSKGNIWVGTLSNGIKYISWGQNVFSPPPIAEGQSMLNANYISAIAEDKYGNIWVGGTSGIDIIDPSSGVVKHFNHNFDKANSLIHDNVLSILMDDKANVWLGTQGGLSLYLPEKNCFQNFTTIDGLPHNTVLTLLENDGEIWMSTPNGLASLNLGSEEGNNIIRIFNKSDGLQANSFNENAAYKTSYGELIFGGAKGFNIIQPRQLLSNANAPKVIFTDFQLFNQSLQIDEEVNGRPILSASLSETPQITLKYFENVFSVSFAALNFIHPEKNFYKYKLEGFDADWRLADINSRQVTYTNLDPGSYVLQVIAANNDGVWSEIPALLHIKVSPPFYLTRTAYMFYFLVAMAVLYFARIWVFRRAKAKFRIEQERREAQQLHEFDLMKIRFFTNLSHEFRTPLSLILAPSEKILKEAENEKQIQQFQLINRNAKRLLNLVNQLLDFRKIEVEGMDLNPSEGNIIKFIEETVYSFNELSEKKSIQLNFKAELEVLFVSFDMDKLEKILFNLLSNAVKFTPEYGAISVEVFLEDIGENTTTKNLRILVKDNGIGIPEEHQTKIFERFYKHELPENMINQGSGIGLSITKEFVRLHGGTISLDSTPGLGSCFNILIPVKLLENKLPLDSPNQLPSITNIPIVNQTEEPLLNNTLPNTNKAFILIVEDNDDFRTYLKDCLEGHFEVEEAKNGKEGWKKTLGAMPALIVSDLMMPVMNGLDFCKKVKNDPRTSHIPVILLTAFSAQEQKLEGLNIGANDYVTKPFNFELLHSRINNLIKQNQLLQQVFEKKVSVASSQVDIISMDDKFIHKVMKLVEDHLSDPDFSVEFLSKEMGMSRVHLYNKLSAIAGKSPLEFIRHLRLQRSLQYLEKSQLSVSEVAYKVGFNSAKTFTKYFKAEFHMLPSAYAASIQNPPIEIK